MRGSRGRLATPWHNGRRSGRGLGRMPKTCIVQGCALTGCPRLVRRWARPSRPCARGGAFRELPPGHPLPGFRDGGAKGRAVPFRAPGDGRCVSANARYWAFVSGERPFLGDGASVTPIVGRYAPERPILGVLCGRTNMAPGAPAAAARLCCKMRRCRGRGVALVNGCCKGGRCRGQGVALVNGSSLCQSHKRPLLGVALTPERPLLGDGPMQRPKMGDSRQQRPILGDRQSPTPIIGRCAGSNAHLWAFPTANAHFWAFRRTPCRKSRHGRDGTPTRSGRPVTDSVTPRPRRPPHPSGPSRDRIRCGGAPATTAPVAPPACRKGGLPWTR